LSNARKPSKKVAVLTVGRSDYSILRPVLFAIQAHDQLNLEIIATGSHLVPKFGMTIGDIERDDFVVAHRVDMLDDGGSPRDISSSIARGIKGLGDVFASSKPDVLVIMGDRFEMLAGAIAATPFCIPIAHIHGGETSEGAFDESIRHSITKFSYLHFVSHPRYRQRVIQMGEAPERVFISGAPAIDNIAGIRRMSVRELEDKFGLDLSHPPLLVTFHSTTLDIANLERHTAALIDALSECGQPVIFTAPNADTGHEVIFSAIQSFVDADPRTRYIPSFGVEGYYNLLRHISAMVGNSSSGILESGSFAVPVVNIGDRQRGRESGRNVIHVNPEKAELRRALAAALDPKFKASLIGMKNIYGEGNAADLIADVIGKTTFQPGMLMKSFHDLPLQ
jgi:UDP-hydrolysing UDP-N-acetyl-D-glucosamine 2-epimerase